MAQPKNYIKGLFANTRVTQWGEEINIDLSDESIEHIKTLPKNDKGMRKLTVSKKKDPSKWSVYENIYTPKSNAGENSNSSDNLPF